MEKNEPIRVAQIIGKWLGGGVESVVMNYYRHIDRTKIQFDFICDEDSTNIPYEEIEKLGGRVIICPSYTKIFRYQKFLIDLFKRNKYKIVHSNLNTLSFFPLRAAYKAEVPIRIAHSHSTIINDRREWKRNFIKNILKHFSGKYANVYFACSKSAAISQFGKKAFDCGRVTIIHNAIDIKKFEFNENKRNQIRKKLNIDESTFVIGHVGRFVITKNHKFLIDIFNDVHKKNKNSKLLLVGHGKLESKIKRYVNDLNLNKDVIFVGQVNNVSDYYNIMDAFVLPSLYEGLGISLIEAQANGLSSIASKGVPQETNITGKIKYIDLKDKEEFVKTLLNINKQREHNIIKLVDTKYNIEKETKKLNNIYMEFKMKIDEV